MGKKKKTGDAPRYRKLFPMFWRDAGVRSLSAQEKLIAAYCLTSHQTNRIGLFAFSISLAAEDLGIGSETFAKGFANVCETLNWSFDNEGRCLFIPTWWKWNCPEGVNVMKGCLRDFLEVPESVLCQRFTTNEKHLASNLLETFRERFRNLTETLPNTGAGAGAGKQEQEQEQESRKAGKQDSGFPNGKPRASGDAPNDRAADVRAVFAHYRTYHAKSHPKPASTSKEWRAIAARLKEGYSVADLCLAIDGNHKCPWNCGENPGGKLYQSLELIVRDGSKVAHFIEQANADKRPVLSEKTQRTQRAADSYLERRFAEMEGEDAILEG